MIYCKFLEHYRHYTQGNETPESLHLWCGLVGIAGAAERRYWIDRDFFKIILNLYIMFLAPAGVCAKSTAMKLCSDLLEEVGCYVFEGSITKRKIVSDMTDSIKSDEINGKPFQHSSVTFAADEFNELISSGGGEIIKFLTTIFSKPNRYVDRTQTQGSFELPRPFLNIVGNVVPQWFSQNLANDLSSTGLLARFIIVTEKAKRGQFPKPIITPEQITSRTRALEILLWIYNNSGEIKMSDEAEAYYDAWYREQNIDQGEDFRLVDYLVRKSQIHVLKVAALMTLGDCRKIMEVIDLQRSIYILDAAEKKLSVFYKEVGSNRFGMYIERIRNILDEVKMVPTRKITAMLSSNLTSEEIVSVLKTLKITGAAKIETIKGVSYLIKAKKGDKLEVEGV